MNGWRERLCGSTITPEGEDESRASLEQFIHPPRTISCGGGFYPVNENVANMATNQNFLLPTKSYSVLMFRDDGTAVIYSEEEGRVPLEDLEMDFEATESDF